MKPFVGYTTAANEAWDDMERAEKDPLFAVIKEAYLCAEECDGVEYNALLDRLQELDCYHHPDRMQKILLVAWTNRKLPF